MLLPFLHAAHDVREAVDGLRVVSFAVVGFAIGALVLTWSRLLAWLRSTDDPAPRLRRWGEDDEGPYFEFFREPSAEWQAELADGSLLPLRRQPDGLLRGPTRGQPAVAIVAIVDSDGLRLPL